jgi:hypothetical protein
MLVAVMLGPRATALASASGFDSAVFAPREGVGRGSGQYDKIGPAPLKKNGYRPKNLDVSVRM